MAVGQFYKESGKFSPGGALLPFLVGPLCAALAGSLYGVVDAINPLIIINVLGTCLMPVMIGVAACLGGNYGHVRKASLVGLAGLLAGLIGLYCSWGAWIYALTDWKVDLFTSPGMMFEVILEINKEGAWSMKSLRPTGIFLWMIWGSEALVVVLGSWFLAFSGADVDPYCEQLGCWAEENVSADLELPEDLPTLLKDVEAQEFGALATLGPSPAGATAFLRAKVKFCDKPKTPFFLVIEKVEISKDDNGNDQESTDTVLAHFQVEEVVREVLQIKADGGSSEEADTEAPEDGDEDSAAE